MNICGRDDLFLVFTSFWAEQWTYANAKTFFCLHLFLGGKVGIWLSAHMMTLKELVLLLRSENMVTLAGYNQHLKR